MKKCTAYSEHDHWCDCGSSECWEEELRLKINFDNNVEREVCILFIHRLLQKSYDLGKEDERQRILIDARELLTNPQPDEEE